MDLAKLNGSWALVTGASAGIGREFAIQLAARKINLVLIARRALLLNALADELHARHGVQAMPATLDLTVPGAIDILHKRLCETGIRPRLLVNNAGIGRWGKFEAASAEAYAGMVRLNIESVVELCRAFLPELGANTPSAIINLSSLGALQPVPYMAVYAATKSFVQNFSLALYEEWRRRGVYIQTLVPGPTATESVGVTGAYPSRLVEKCKLPRAVVEASLQAFVGEQPLVKAARGIFAQRVFGSLVPIRIVLTATAKMFRP